MVHRDSNESKRDARARYREEFVQACARTRRLIPNAPAPALSLTAAPLGSDERDLLRALAQAFRRESGVPAIECVPVALRLEHVVNESRLAAGLITLGYLDTPRGPAFACAESDFAAWVAAGPAVRPLRSLHAWVTLSTGEVLDGAILPRMRSWGCSGAPEGDDVLLTDPDAPEYGITYRPVTAGIPMLLALGTPEP